MGLKQKFVQTFFKDVISDEVKKQTNGHITHIDGMTEAEAFLRANKLANKLKGVDFQKSSKQVIAHKTGPSTEEGILPDVDFEVFQKMYEETSWVWAAIGVIRRAVTARGFSIVPTIPNANPLNAETLKSFFSDANPNDTIIELLDDLTRDIYVFGNAYLEIVFGPNPRDSSKQIPKELWTLDAPSLRVKADTHGNVLGFVQVPRFGTSGRGARVNFESREVIHFKFGSRGSTVYGLSPLNALVLPVTVDKYAQIYNRAFFLNGAKLRGAFIMKDATPEQVERNREYLQARAKNLDMAQADMVLEGSVEFKQVGVNQKDMEFQELRIMTRQEALSCLGVAPEKINLVQVSGLGMGAGEQQDTTFFEETIIPLQNRIAEKINKHVIRNGFGIKDWSFQFNKRAIDEKDQAEIFSQYIESGVLTPEEVRRMILPRMPELQKDLPLPGSRILVKGEIKPSKTIVDATNSIIKLENEFADRLERLFLNIKNLIVSQIPSIVRTKVEPTTSKIKTPFDVHLDSFNDLLFIKFDIPEAAKGIEDIDIILELIDENGIRGEIESFTLDGAKIASSLASERFGIEASGELSLGMTEFIRTNSAGLAKHIKESVDGAIKEALVEGFANDEAIEQITDRIEKQLGSITKVKIRGYERRDGTKVRESIRNPSRRATAESIARTETSRVYNRASLDAFERSGIKQAEFLLAKDACPICRDVSETLPGATTGKIFAVDQARFVIPVHPQCRCSWAPVTENQ